MNVYFAVMHTEQMNYLLGVEVVTFILYEAYPSDRRRKRKAEVNAEELMVDNESLFEGLRPLNGKDFNLPEI